MSNNETGLAYVDKVGILHILRKTDGNGIDAKERAKNGVIEVDIQFNGGYPVVEGKEIVVYGLNECYTDGNRAEGVKLDTEKTYPELAKLYKKLV